ncbi:phage tail tape measure protein [Stenotrophomonas sp. HMWF003]|uniref:phage tail tape measure protein n=1 Tax=Stenotrophomonas sp. HMWF003 TaxID=2056840 RepID=UPI000D400E73|nr:phage tail tape measure protein [Stenotrophomonas sp. HMWF003]PTT63197.1 phage tail tape measure protein [Stenotrophomonas sp. HMWF003]
MIANIGGFANGMDKSERAAEKWRKNVEKQAKAAGTALGIGISVGVAGLTALTVATARQAAEIGKLAQVAGVGVVEFQRFAAGADAFGIQQDKLADIFKDTQDKVGDFLQNGGGPLADFFDNIAPKVGVTAKQFQNLSGPQALQLYADSLEKANLSQGDMVFYMEALANDATMLTPLLRDGGQGFADFADAAERAGAILGEDVVADGQKLKVQMWLVEQQLTGFKNSLVSDILPVITDLGATLVGSGESGRKALHDYNAIGTVIRWISQAAAGGVAAFDLLGKTIGGTAAVIGEIPSGWDAMMQARQTVKDDLDATAQYWAGVIGDFGKAGTAAGAASAEVEKLQALLGQAGAGSGAAGSQGGNAKGAKEAATAQQQLQQAYEAASLQYQRQIALFDTSAEKSAKATELQQLNFDLAEGALKDLNAQDKERLRTLASTLDGLEAVKVANEQAAMAAEFARNTQDTLENARGALSVDLVGAGAGAQARERALALLEIEKDYQQKRNRLFEQYQAGKVTEKLYEAETDVLQRALAERLEMQEDHYRKLDALRGDWQAGMSDAWQDYATGAADANQQAYDAVTGFLDTTTGDVAESIADLIKGNESVSESVKNLVVSMGDTVIDTLAKMAAQWLIYQTVQKLVGETTSQSSTAALTGNAVAMAAQAAIAAYASTAAIPITGPIAAPAAAAAALAATAGYVATVAASSGLSGMAHDGIDAVPETGTWLLQKGERVTTASTSAKLDATLDRVNRDTNGGFSAAPITQEIQINGNPDNRTIELIRQAARDGAQMGYERVKSDMARGTGVSKTMRATHNVGRRVR